MQKAFERKHFKQMFQSGCIGSYISMKMKEPLIAAKFYKQIADNLLESSLVKDALRVYGKMLKAAYCAKTFAR